MRAGAFSDAVSLLVVVFELFKAIVRAVRFGDSWQGWESQILFWAEKPMCSCSCSVFNMVEFIQDLLYLFCYGIEFVGKLVEGVLEACTVDCVAYSMVKLKVTICKGADVFSTLCNKISLVREGFDAFVDDVESHSDLLEVFYELCFCFVEASFWQGFD